MDLFIAVKVKKEDDALALPPPSKGYKYMAGKFKKVHLILSYYMHFVQAIELLDKVIP